MPQIGEYCLREIATKSPGRMSKPAHAETKDAIITWHRHDFHSSRLERGRRRERLKQF
jgi:hypothetical protein